jgi:radical SAM superfamily enzyme YgiQ (UPF0313 family)
MERPAFALITLNGQKGPGPRYVAAASERAGIETHLIHVKLFRSREVSHEESIRIGGDGVRFVARVHPTGDELVPFPTELSDTEIGLLEDELRRIAPTLVGISFTTGDLPKAQAVTRAVHERLPGVPVVWGGIHAILNPESCIQEADIVCTGEGDEVLVEYFADPARRDVRGLWFRDKVEGANDRIARNAQRPLIGDLDSLPFPKYGGHEIYIDEDRVDRSPSDPDRSIHMNYHIVTARGCPFACSYCLHSNIRDLYPGQKYLRRRSVENVVRELEMRARQGSIDGYIPIFDEIFVKDPEWIAEFTREYGRRVGLPFSGYSHEAFTTLDMIRSLAAVGMVGTTFGFQSGSDRLCREVYRRRNNYDRILSLSQGIQEMKCLDALVFEGLTNTPFETEEDCQATLDFLLRLPTPFYLLMSKLMIFPGTEIASMPRVERPLDEKTFRFWNMLYLMTQSPGIPRDAIRSLVQDDFLRAHPEVLEHIVEGLLPRDALVSMVDNLKHRTSELQRQRFLRPPLWRRAATRLQRAAAVLAGKA